MATADTHSAKKEIDDLTECPVCSDIFNDPRTLPCIHTYCLECIKGWCQGKPPGVKADCPLCRKAFVIPVGGVQCLPKNFIMEKLKQIKLPSVNVSDQVLCDTCCTNNSTSCSQQSAVMRCIDCGKKLCKKCDEAHQTASATPAHRREKLEVHPINGPTVCVTHKNKNLELYCEGCQVSLCAICYIESHKSHKCTDIDRVAHDFRRLLMTNTKSIGDLSMKWRKDLRHLEEDREDFLHSSRSAEDEIIERAEHLIRIVEADKQRNLKSLTEIQTDRLNEVDCLIEKIEQQLMLMESLQTYSTELCSKGTSGNIVKNAKLLQQRAEALMKWDSVSSELNRLNSVSVIFSASNIANGLNSGCIIGQVVSKVTKPFADEVNSKKFVTTTGKECRDTTYFQPGDATGAGDCERSQISKSRGRRRDRNRRGATVRCYSCNEYGHTVRHCPRVSPSQHQESSDCSNDSRESSPTLRFGRIFSDNGASSSQVICSRCRQRGHAQHQCLSGGGGGGGHQPGQCYSCGIFGHHFRQCPN